VYLSETEQFDPSTKKRWTLAGLVVLVFVRLILVLCVFGVAGDDVYNG
jgi:hypothetical protein